MRKQAGSSTQQKQVHKFFEHRAEQRSRDTSGTQMGSPKPELSCFWPPDFCDFFRLFECILLLFLFVLILHNDSTKSGS